MQNSRRLEIVTDALSLAKLKVRAERANRGGSWKAVGAMRPPSMAAAPGAARSRRVGAGSSARGWDVDTEALDRGPALPRAPAQRVR